MPEGAVYVGRPTKWGNPWKLSDPMEVFMNYEDHLNEQIAGGKLDLSELRGKDLACWCPLDLNECHAEVLLRRANQ